jgi:hypothetical protein
MKLWIATSINGNIYYHQSVTIGEAHRAARNHFGKGISFVVREANETEEKMWRSRKP